MERVLDVYKRPYDKDCPVVCIDGSPKQFIEEKRHTIAMKPSQEERVDDYKTHASTFYETFRPKEEKRLCDRFEFVYTPKHGSWLNMAEIKLHILNGQ